MWLCEIIAMFRFWNILSYESNEKFQLKKCVNKYDWLFFWLPARGDCVFSGNHHQIIFAICMWSWLLTCNLLEIKLYNYIVLNRAMQSRMWLRIYAVISRVTHNTMYHFFQNERLCISIEIHPWSSLSTRRYFCCRQCFCTIHSLREWLHLYTNKFIGKIQCASLCFRLFLCLSAAVCSLCGVGSTTWVMLIVTLILNLMINMNANIVYKYHWS